ncbi:MAG: succinate dehydrogenase [Gemmatimonadetes bacterium]|nr:succinate dehydrogenase [Gemmatimonadota bacterium]
MSHATVPLTRRRYGETMRQDAWWVEPLIVFVILTSFLVYATWAAFQNAHYTAGPYLSPFYSPEIFGDSPHAWFGPKPGWWPAWLPFSPALIILPFPALFRFTCYYYRGSYYKAFWADPPGCSVGEPRKTYLGERYFPLILQNVHRYFMVTAVLFLGFLTYDVYLATQFTDAATGATSFGIGLGTLVLAANVVCLGGYTLGCHSMRHILGGWRDQFSKNPAFRVPYNCSSCLNRSHHRWAWVSLFMVAFADIYVRLCSMGIWTDLRLF